MPFQSFINQVMLKVIHSIEIRGCHDFIGQIMKVNSLYLWVAFLTYMYKQIPLLPNSLYKCK